MIPALIPEPPTASGLPEGEAAVSAAAERLGLTIDPVCMSGVLDNLRLLERQAAKLLGSKPAELR